MLASDWGWQYLTEENYGVQDEQRFMSIVRNVERVVIQAPAMTHMMIHMANVNVFVVWMMRPLADILRSQKRIGWECYEAVERAKYAESDNDMPIAAIKYKQWERDRSKVAHVELSYDSLRSHPMFINKAKRRAFGPRQTA
jgi:hypothetical protein